MQKINLDVEPRDLGKKDQELNTNQLRKQGWVPGVVYGHGKPVKIAVHNKVFSKAISSEAGVHALFNVKLSGKISLGIIKDIQRDIFTQEPIHIDFQRINVKEKITTNIPVHTNGEPLGVKNDGGILEIIQREVEIRCLPDNIPPRIDLDVSNLNIHDSIKVQDLKLGSDVEILTPSDHIIVNVVPPRVEEIPEPVAATGEEGAPAEPEVISKGKKPEEGEEGEAPAKPSTKEPAKEAKK